jgi:hypothetical protein
MNAFRHCRKIDKCLSACLIEPLFRCLQMLVEEDPDDRDLHVSHLNINNKLDNKFNNLSLFSIFTLICIINTLLSLPFQCIAHIVVNSGRQLSQLNPTECDRLVLACRRWLCSNRVPLEEETRRLLMNVGEIQ